MQQKASHNHFVGVDLGGTKIAAILQRGDVSLQESTRPTEAHEGPKAVVDRIAEHVRALCQSAGVDTAALGGVGVGIPGVIDYENRQTRIIPNLPGNWVGFPVADRLQLQLGCPVWLINDARAFSLAEATYGAGKGAGTVACFTVGTGIGGGIVIGGKLHMGFKGAAAELGHQIIDPDGPRCGCGSQGCLETLASGPAITAAGVRTIVQGMESAIGHLVNHDITKVTPAIIKAAAEGGDHIAAEILQRAGTYLGLGISNVITILAPERVIIGGGAAALGDWLLNPVRAEIQKRCHTVSPDDVDVLPAALGAYAGATGAAIWSRQHATLVP